MGDIFNINLVKQTGNKLEMLSSKKIKPEDIEIKLNKSGEIVCADDKYEIHEITGWRASKILEYIEENSSLWQRYMSSSEDHPFSHLIGKNNGELY